MKKKMKLMISLICVAIVCTLWIGFCGYNWGWGPFASFHNMKTSSLPGNAERYAVTNMEALPDSILRGDTIIFLGSSVTLGYASKEVSFVDYIAARNGCKAIKEAVSGTTLVDDSGSSYISRMKKIDQSIKADLFVCQLSTNDASKNKELGEISTSTNIDSFDTNTVAGAIEYIIAYAKNTWGCEVIFYTNPKYDSERYAEMVGLMNRIASKWNIAVIDMWSDEEFNNISDENRKLYMADNIHPTQAGYSEWWTPYFEKVLSERR